MTSNNRPSFGWLILGMAWGLLAGHAFGMFFVVPQFDSRDYARWCLFAMLAGGMLGIGVGALIDCFTKRSATWLDWVVFPLVVLLYLMLMPAVGAAAE